MRRLFCLICATGAVACTVRTQGLALSDTVQVVVTDPQNLGVPGPLGVAVVWVGLAGVEPTASVPVDLDAGGTVSIPVEPPADFAQLDAGPLETLQLGPGVVVYRPRVVVYEDLFGGSFAFDGLDAGAGDRVLGADGQDSVAYILDAEGMLQSLGASETDRYYAATGGRLTPFVRVHVDSNGALQLNGEAPVPLALNEGDLADADLGCMRAEQESSVSLSRAFAAPPTVHVNTGLDAATICGTVAGKCTQEGLALERGPLLTPFQVDDHEHFLECRRSGLLESVLVLDAKNSCAGCSCSWAGGLDVYVASSTALPPWWPCGLTLPYCDLAGSLLTLNLTCALSKG